MAKDGENQDLELSASKKKRSPQVYPAQRLSEITVTRARQIASQLRISNYSKMIKDNLIPLIREQMALVTDCQPCGGGPCCPDDHVFPASDNVEGVHETGSDTSNTEDSPNRQLLRSLNQTQHRDENVPGFDARSPFAQHVTDAVLSDAGGSGARPQPPSTRTSPESVPLPPSSSVSSDEEDQPDEEFEARLREQQAQWDLEYNTAHNAVAEKSKELEAANARRREERDARRLEKQKRQMEEALQKHKDRMNSLQPPPPRSSRTRSSAGSDNDVFTTPQNPSPRTSDRSRPDARVSFTRPSPPRSESARPADSRFHPGYTEDSRRPPRSRSTGSDISVDFLADLMDRQAESQAMMAAAMEKLASASAGAGQVPISALSGFGNPDGSTHCHKSSSSGNLKLVKPGNPEMARALGVNPRVNWAFKGDMDDVDISKLKKMNLVSGKNRTNEGLVLQQHYWPHDCVSRASLHLLPPGFVFAKLKHEDLTFAMFQEGMIQKILMDSVNLDNVVKNKLQFTSKLIRMAYTLPWPDILSIAEQFLEAFEFNQATWDDWAEIERFLKDAYDQAKMASFLHPGTAPAGASSNPLAPAPPAAPRGPKKEKKYVDNANGVPWKYMKEKKLCGGYNIGSCERKGDHKIGSDTVHHYCAGCFGKSNGTEKLAHRALTCPKGPFDPNLFG